MTSPVKATSPNRTDEAGRQAYEAVLERLSKASVDKHWEPYIDIPWDHPDYRVDPADPRWTLLPVDKLAGHPWYTSLPQEKRSEIALWRIATSMKIGLQFENVLKRGLLNYAYRLPNGSPEFRYAYHEMIEEGHHGMMFQEFVNRTKLPIVGLPWAINMIANTVPWIPLISTELFFIHVLGGEDPIDHVQRKMLKDPGSLHPLLAAIIRIHVAEEARHLSFARHYMRHRVPRLPYVRRFLLSLLAPLILAEMGRIMIAAPPSMIRRFRIPPDVARAISVRNPAVRAEIRDSVAKTRELCAEIGLINPVSRRVWQALGIWDETPARKVVA